jgi:hypothetical protein
MTVGSDVGSVASPVPAPTRDRRLVDAYWPGWRLLPAADGLVAFLPGHRAHTAWADVVLAHDTDGFVVWAATGAKPAPSLNLVTRRAGVHAVALAPAGADPRHVQAALRFGCRLASEAAGQDHAAAPVPVTSARGPDATDELVALPHLVTLHTGSGAGPPGAATDTVLWELVTADAVASRLCTPQSALSLIEARLPTLLALRTATRTGRVPGLPPPVAALLAGLAEPLSAEVVWRHLDLLLDHLAGHPASHDPARTFRPRGRPVTPDPGDDNDYALHGRGVLPRRPARPTGHHHQRRWYGRGDRGPAHPTGRP